MIVTVQVEFKNEATGKDEYSRYVNPTLPDRPLESELRQMIATLGNFLVENLRRNGKLTEGICPTCGSRGKL